jgi:type VI secretion system secreted protein Hcp
MAYQAFLKLKGAKQGDIKGSVTQKGREGLIAVIAVDHEITSPRDIGTGQASGKRQHQPLTIVKELDRSSVPLRQALVTNEVLTEWELQFWAPTPQGAEILVFTIRLTNATIASLHFIMRDIRDPQFSNRAPYEEVAFTYQKIEWVWADGGLTAGDDWTGRA